MGRRVGGRMMGESGRRRGNGEEVKRDKDGGRENGRLWNGCG